MHCGRLLVGKDIGSRISTFDRKFVPGLLPLILPEVHPIAGSYRIDICSEIRCPHLLHQEVTHVKRKAVCGPCSDIQRAIDELEADTIPIGTKMDLGFRTLPENVARMCLQGHKTETRV